jgi:hypothetical protein
MEQMDKTIVEQDKDIEDIRQHLLKYKRSRADVKYDSDIVKQNIIDGLGDELSRRVTFIKVKYCN